MTIGSKRGSSFSAARAVSATASEHIGERTGERGEFPRPEIHRRGRAGPPLRHDRGAGRGGNGHPWPLVAGGLHGRGGSHRRRGDHARQFLPGGSRSQCELAGQRAPHRLAGGRQRRIIRHRLQASGHQTGGGRHLLRRRHQPHSASRGRSGLGQLADQGRGLHRSRPVGRLLHRRSPDQRETHRLAMGTRRWARARRRRRTQKAKSCSMHSSCRSRA